MTFEVVQAWLSRPTTRRDRVLGAAVTAFVGFWLGCIVGIGVSSAATSLDGWTIALGFAVGASVIGGILGWRRPKQALIILGARAFFRNRTWRY